MKCPKCDVEMELVGDSRHDRAWRCPKCKVFKMEDK